MQPKSPSRSEQDAPRAPRKSYRKPKLQAYGDLAEVTKNINGSKTNDGAGHPNKHYTS
jgi:hypothetical protein